MSKLTGQEKIYQMITDQILNKLEEGIIPWKQSWKAYATKGGVPMNLVSNKAYRGINPMLLNMQGFESPYWLTFNQAKKLKGNVIKGQHGTTVVFWKFLKKADTRENENGELETVNRTIPMLRFYTVFNIEQCENISHKRLKAYQEALENVEPEPEFDPIESAELIWNGYRDKPELNHGEARAYYRPADDSINMPKRSAFDKAANYYNVLFHEAVHSTGAAKRLDREGIKNFSGFGSNNYGKEELVAEMGAAFLSGTAGFSEDVIDDSVAYIDNWKKAIKGDRKMVIHAAAQAQKATDYILDIEPEYNKES